MEKGTKGGSAARQGGQCEFGREEAAGRWRTAAHLGSRMKQSTAKKWELLSKTNEHLYFSELIAYRPFQELLPLCSP